VNAHRIRGALATLHDRDAGSVTLFVVIVALGLLVLAGLVVDGGAKVRAAQRADRVAAEAARAAGQAVDATAILRGQAIRVDAAKALAAAQAHLRAAGVEGSASVTAGGSHVVVTTSARVPTIFLGLIGVPDLTAQGRAEAALVTYANGELP
jgi:Flp pilus assembly protein TadG